MQKTEPNHMQPNSDTTTGPAAEGSFSGCIMPNMASPGQQSERLNAQLLVDSIPALIHTAMPDGYLDYFNKPWLEYLGVTLDKVAGWNWTAFVHPEDVEGILATWRACLATGEVFKYETRVRRANGEYRWMFHRKVPLRDANGNIVKWYGSSLDIDERKTAEEQLRRNAQELQRSEFYLAEGQRLAHIGSWAFDPDGFDYWSPELFRMHGLDSGSQPPKAQEYLDLVHPQDRESMVGLIKRLLAEASPFDVTKRIVRPDGEVRHIRCVGAPLVADQSLKKYVGSAIDVTEHELLTQELRRREAYLTGAQRLSHTGSFGWRPDTGEIVWSDETYRIFEYERSVKPTMDSVVQRVHPQDRADFQKVIDGASRGATDFEHTYRLLLPDGRVKHVRAIAHVLQNASGNREFVGAATDITEQRHAEAVIREQEAKLRNMLDLMPQHVFVFGPDGNPIYANQGALEYFGVDADQLLAESRINFVHPDDREHFLVEKKKGLLMGAPHEFETRLLRHDGTFRWFLSRRNPLKDERGQILRWYGTATDIEDRKRAEESLRSSEAYLAEAQRLSHTGSWAWSPDQDIRYWSEECYRVLGFDPRDGLPRMEELIQRIHPDDQPAFRESAKRATHRKLDEEVDYRIVHPGGAVRDIHSIGHPVFSPSGDLIEFTGTVIDITERKRAEEELQQLVDFVGQIITVLSSNGKITYANRVAREYTGLTLAEYRSVDVLARVIHPDDVDRMRAVRERGLSANNPFEIEARTLGKGGACRWFLYRYNPLHDEQGQITRWYVTGTDIEDRKLAEDSLRQENVALKRAEEKIREQEAELRQMLDFTPLYLGVNGPDGSPLYANRASLDYLGMSLDEWRQRPMDTHVHPDDVERLNRASSSGSACELEVRVRKGDGTFRWILARFNPLRDENGQITRWYTASTDIDDRKRTEEKLQQENVALREEIDKASMFEEIVGTSPALKSVLSRISKVAPSDSTVLITGETGTGKELFARAIHRRSDRASRAFVSVNCAAIPRDLIASELFGHEKGAFTGATQQRLGRFELANGGTLFLDEVGELPAETQIALLRVLQEHEFERVGGSRRIRADVRVISATNRDLQAAIGAGSFRSDLFYRLNVFPIEIPSLRERRADIPLLVEYFIDRYARKAGKNIRGVNKKTLELLQLYPWPGNIRELQNVIERSVILCETEIFSIDENWLSQPPPLTPESKQQVELPTKLLVQEKDMIEAALKDTRGRVSGPTGAAAKLGIPRSTLESKIRSLKIDKNRFRTSPET